MKKALMLASVASMIEQFNMPNIKILQELGYEVHVACNFEFGNTSSVESIEKLKDELKNSGVKAIHIPIPRRIMDIKDILRSFGMVKRLVNKHQYEIVHCQSPIGGVITRLACKKARRKGTRVIYVAHGFHFYKSASIKKWLMFYPIEKYCAKYTDCLVTINYEDYHLAKKKMSKISRIEYIPGVGTNTELITNTNVNKDKKKEEIGIPQDATVLLIVGEFIKRKNHETAIRAFASANMKNTILLLCGQGPLEKRLKELVDRLHITDKVIFMGYRNDIDEIVNIADIFVFPTYQEGLPISVIEAMAAGLPVICSDIRGNNDLIKEGKGGHLYQPTDIAGFQTAMIELVNSKDLREQMGNFNKENVKCYDITNVNVFMKAIYESI